MKTRDMLSWAKALDEDIQQMAATETHCGHPRGCVVSASSAPDVMTTSHCGWCASIARAAAAEADVQQWLDALEVTGDRLAAAEKLLVERSNHGAQMAVELLNTGLRLDEAQALIVELERQDGQS